MLLVVGLLQIIWDLRVFTQIYILQKAGGIARDTNLLGTYIYRLGIGGGEFGMAAAVAIFMLVLTVVLTAPVRPRHARRRGRHHESSDPTPPCASPPTSSGVLAFLVCGLPRLLDGQQLVPAAQRDPQPDPTWVPFGGDLDNYRTVFDGRPVPRRAAG